MPDCVFTIGHSTHSIEKFIELLKGYAIAAVADVRSRPYSRFNPQFNRDALNVELKKAEMTYIFLGRELGARTDDRTCYVGGKVQYDRLAQTSAFQTGLARVAHEARESRIVLMCAEKDPLTCHRAILVCRHLESRGISAQHILEDGRTETHHEALGRLLLELQLPERDLFRSRDEIVADAYDQRGSQIAYADNYDSSEHQLGGRRREGIHDRVY